MDESCGALGTDPAVLLIDRARVALTSGLSDDEADNGYG